MKGELYSIGHGAKSMDVFTEILLRYQINYLIDVRSLPYSRFHSQFRRHGLEYELNLKNIKYVFMGDQLGGRPKDESCYINGKINYDLVKIKEFFLQGIERLKNAYDSEASVAIMCSESKPKECHRYHLIGKFLEEKNIVLTHIDEKGELVK